MQTYYTVQLTIRRIEQTDKRYELAPDLTSEDLQNHFLTPHRKANALVINGRTIPITQLHRMRIFETKHKIGGFANIPWNMMTEVTNQFIKDAPGSESEQQGAEMESRRPPVDSRVVFVVHGRNNTARDALFAFLRSTGLEPLEWSEAVQATDKALPYIGEVLEAAFSRAHAVVVLLTPDDEARLREPFKYASDPPHETELTGQARPNVLFEAGMAMGRSVNRTVLVELGALRPFTDIGGLHTIRLDNSSQRRQELAQRLKLAHCPVNLEGTDWHTAGDFEAALASTNHEVTEATTDLEQHPPTVNIPTLSNEARVLILEAINDDSRAIIKTKTFGGLKIQTNGKSFGSKGNTRTEARWEGAIRELVDHELIEDQTGNNQYFLVTDKGFEMADLIDNS